MFCSQCEQTTRGEGCFNWGACGKSPDVDALQDLLTHALRGLAEVVIEARSANLNLPTANRFACEALFATLTNVNFDGDRFAAYIQETVERREFLQRQFPKTHPWSDLAQFQPAGDRDRLIQQGKEAEYQFISQGSGDVDIFSLKLTVLYGLKGIAAYAHHAAELGQESDRVYDYFYDALAALGRGDLDLNDWVSLALKLGEINLLAMELLDAANTGAYGHPVPTAVPITPRPGKAILISGHDLKDVEALLQQTAGKGIDVYTHGELLPAHGYPRLKQTYPHLYGHYGTAWQNQPQEFSAFPGPILMTTNCLMPPNTKYEDRVFTLGAVGYPHLPHLSREDLSPVIEQALALPGFTETPERRTVTTGFARNAVLGVADTVVEAVKGGQIRHFFLVGGCDGAKSGRNYYTEFVENVPDDCVVLTLACGKFRFFDKDLGEIGGLPRLMDVGQCNDAYSAIQIALALADAFDTDVNQLPLSMVLSWYEQKAVSILLTLLHLGIRNIRLGPTLPAFISPRVFELLSQTYNLQGISTAEADLAACLAGR
ncbi:hydroxylamine reductase [Phormidium yuhuli AB48]|uniref:Hydroxylamine reductase n=1 Tax=Phormidium yuhuli AB48 TaxID=2940671 RepID=A0ABY5AK82_9CYAN|nr:hydroxylamine reductase [Phormidium yuhuli]USR89363.1 hydroxylamine reductase [Phormidium yuhuli AB48]